MSEHRDTLADLFKWAAEMGYTTNLDYEPPSAADLRHHDFSLTYQATIHLGDLRKRTGHADNPTDALKQALEAVEAEQ